MSINIITRDLQVWCETYFRYRRQLHPDISKVFICLFFLYKRVINYFQFIHNKDDVMNPKSMSLNFLYQTVTDIELIINAIVSSRKVRQLSLSQRKCIFEFESPLKYFKNYSTSLCMISCRMEMALKLCGCIPYFHKISKFIYIL